MTLNLMQCIFIHHIKYVNDWESYNGFSANKILDFSLFLAESYFMQEDLQYGT